MVHPALRSIAHRPWPLPEQPWIMAQVWHDLLFAHWPISPDILRALVPAQLPLDLYASQAWVGVVPFWMSGVRPRALPAIPALSRFPELNVRTYVTVENKPGVFFFSLDASSRLAVWGARTFYHLPYYLARMSTGWTEDWVQYDSRRVSETAELQCRYRADGPEFEAAPGTLEHFLTERYCLYTVSRGEVSRCDIHHTPWRLRTAQAEFATSSVAKASGIELPNSAPHLLFSSLQEVIIWPLRKIETAS
jgi:uncharacterized protein YqjF (DUF2071 family)